MEAYKQEYKLKYGCNPNQEEARIVSETGDLPVKILNGTPGYINFLDALNGWQLVKELQQELGIPAAASFKHVSPAGAAVGLPLSDDLRAAYGVSPELELSPLACAYARARGADRMSSFGDFVALSAPCDLSTAELLQNEVSDGCIAPGFSQEALERLKTKRRGSYAILEIDPAYEPSPLEQKQVFGITFEQQRNNLLLTQELLQKEIPTDKKNFPENAIRDLLLSLIVLKYTQSNSVCYAKDGQAIGIGAGQQSRIHCTRLAGDKADLWWLRQHPHVLGLPLRSDLGRAGTDNVIDLFLSCTPERVTETDVWQEFFVKKPARLSQTERTAWLEQNSGVSLGSDAFFPFSDNIERAAASGVQYIAQPGGSIRDDLVIAAANRFQIVMAFTGVRLFHH